MPGSRTWILRVTELCCRNLDNSPAIKGVYITLNVSCSVRKSQQELVDEFAVVEAAVELI